jgi:hypothetical protein
MHEAFLFSNCIWCFYGIIEKGLKITPNKNIEEQKIEEKKEKDKMGRGALFIPAGLFLGFGIGFAVNNIPAGMFIGFGAGFAVFTISLFLKNK